MKTNRSIVKLSDGREVCLSYGVPVAAFIPADVIHDLPWSSAATVARVESTFNGGYVRTDRKYSTTSSKHANGYAGRDSAVVAHALFCDLVAPLNCR